MRSGRRCGYATWQPRATWRISRAFGASCARGRTGRRLVRREVHLAQLAAGVERHNVVRTMVHGKHLDVLDSGRDEFGARDGFSSLQGRGTHTSTLLAYRGRKPFCRISLECESSHRN